MKIGNMFKILKRTGFPFKYSTEVFSHATIGEVEIQELEAMKMPSHLQVLLVPVLPLQGPSRVTMIVEGHNDPTLLQVQ